MDRWVEPDRPAPRPSFAEAGLERHNVVLNMAPLGTLPSQKIKKSLQYKTEGSDGMGRLGSARKSAPSTASTPGESVISPEPTANSQRRRSVSTNKTEEKPEETVATPTPKTPQQVTSPRKSVSRPSVPPPQSSGQGVFALQRSPIPNVTHAPRPAPTPTQTAQPQPPIVPHNGFREVNFELCDKVVEVAVQEALDRYRYPTAYALRTLYDDHRANVRIVRLIESIYTESATDEQKTEFNSIMKHKKREGKKNRTGEYYFNGDGSDPAPHRPIFQAISAINPPAMPYASPYTPLPRPGSVAVSETPVRSSSLNHQSPASGQKDADHAHISKKQKPNDFQPDDTEVNGISDASVAGAPVVGNGEGNAGNIDADTVTKTENAENGIDSVENRMNIAENGFAPADIATEPANVDVNANVNAGVDIADKMDTMSGSPQNGADGQRRRSRSRSNSSSSSLSSVNEDALEGAFASAKNSPAVKSSTNQMNSPSSGTPIIGSGHLGFGGPVAQPRFVSPYTNANTFSAAAETLVRNQAPPITKSGPRFHTFAVTPSTSSAAVPPSSSSNTSNNDNNQTPSNPSMAPAVLPPSSSTSSSTPGPKFTPTFKVKGYGKKLQGYQPLDENDQSSRLKRKAREVAAANYQPVESYDRHQVVIPSQDAESQSDGPDSIAVVASKRPQKKKGRITITTSYRETRHSSTRSNNYDSEENALSSPTALGFHPHLAPGSTPSSRAATPNASSRQPTRKAKSGTGLRVKSS
jgi:hypothetical protein